jgi:hypothetical protein
MHSTPFEYGTDNEMAKKLRPCLLATSLSMILSAAAPVMAGEIKECPHGSAG